MSVKKFKFVSPGIFINEIDNSQIPKLGADVGPVIVGRTLRGPAMRPVRIESFSDFVETFGEPQAGGVGGDIWRDGNRLGPTYAAYAAQAYLRNSSPITFVRLLGEDHPDKVSTAIDAGFTFTPALAQTTPDTAQGRPGPVGLFIANGGTAGANAKQTVVVSGVDKGDQGFDVGLDGDESEAGGKVTTEISADHVAVKVTCVAEATGGTTSAAGNYSTSGSGGTDDGVQTLILADIGGSGVTSRTYAVGHASEGAGSVDVPVVDGASASAVATALAAHINSVDGDILEAISNSADVYIRQKTRGGVYAQNLNVTQNAIGGGSTENFTIVKGEVNPFSQTSGSAAFTHGDFTATDGAYLASDGDVSIIKAWEALGFKGSSANVADGGGGSAGLDAAVATQLADVIKSGTGSFNGQAGYTATTVGGTITITCGHAGTAGNSKAVDVGGGAASGGGGVTRGGATFADGTATAYTMNAALAAIFYVEKGGVTLVGEAANLSGASSTVDAMNTWVKSDGANSQFKLRARNPGSSVTSGVGDLKTAEDIAFNFDKNSRVYIRNVMNTNPTLTNDKIVDGAKLKGYFLGQTFDEHLSRVQGDAGIGVGAAKAQFACLIPLADAGDYEASMQEAQSPWVISQHNGEPSNFNLKPDSTDGAALLSNDVTLESKGIEKLFRFASLYSGEWERKNLKISIYDIKAPTDKFNPYGTFSVMIRKRADTDAAPQVVERFSSCSLNPASPDFIARKIGDMKTVWDDTERRYVSHGLYENQSRFIRVILSTAVEQGSADPRLLPFGFYGPPRRAALKFTTHASTALQVALEQVDPNGVATGGGSAIIQLDKNCGLVRTQSSNGTTGFAEEGASGTPGQLNTGHKGDSEATAESWNMTMLFPKVSARYSTKDSTLSSPRDAFFGVSSLEYGSDTRIDDSYQDAVGFGARGIGTGVDPAGMTDNKDEFQFIFTLDDIKYATPPSDGTPTDPNRMPSPPVNFEWVPGCHARDYIAGGDLDSAACSLTAYAGVSGTSGPTALKERSYTAILDAGIDAFTLPLMGGHDGLDITQVDPFGYHSSSSSNTNLPAAGESVLDHYALNSIKKAIDAVADPEVVEMNLLAMPGLTHPSSTAHAVAVCEKRGDALAIIDIEGDYQPIGIDEKDEAGRMPKVDTAINKMRQRALNSSYGCCFFPWVSINDSMTGRTLWAPPSTVALGVMGSSAERSELWFAPAGFTRGGLTDGAAGIGVNGVRLRLNSKERDKLYEANINPIAQFPAEGIVIFGQKTLQITPSALDRINVRRLMIFLKKEISRMAKTILFDQNVQATWTRFISQADPFLASVKGRFGLSEYKIVLDETTTTPELIDRNIMYAKILLKPAKAIEYIAIDFVITDSGASFDD